MARHWCLRGAWAASTRAVVDVNACSVCRHFVGQSQLLAPLPFPFASASIPRPLPSALYLMLDPGSCLQRIPYHEVISREARQDAILTWSLRAAAAAGAVAAGYVAVKKGWAAKAGSTLGSLLDRWTK